MKAKEEELLSCRDASSQMTAITAVLFFKEVTRVSRPQPLAKTGRTSAHPVSTCLCATVDQRARRGQEGRRTDRHDASGRFGSQLKGDMQHSAYLFAFWLRAFQGHLSLVILSSRSNQAV